MAATTLSATPMAHAVVQGSGYLEYQTRLQDFESGEKTKARIGTARFDVTTPLGAPWIGQFTGGLGISLTKTDTDDSRQDGEVVTGDLDFRLFPRSHFPLELFASRRDSRISGDLAGPDILTDIFSLRQSYLSKHGGRYSLLFRRTEFEQSPQSLANAGVAGAVDTTDDFLSFSLNETFKEHTFDLRSDRQDIDRREPDELETRIFNFFEHRYARGIFSTNTFVSHSDDELEQLLSQRRNKRLQLNSTNYWRPLTPRPLLVNLNVLASDQENDVNGIGSDSDSLTLNGGATYQWSPALTLRGSLSGTSQRSDGEDNNSSLLLAGVNYAPAPIRFQPFDLSWSVFGTVGNRTDDRRDDSSIQEISGGGSWGLSRIRPLGTGQLDWNFTQQLDAIKDTDERDEQNLLHTASAGWNRQHDNASLFVRFTGSDTRRFTEQNGEDVDQVFQLLNLQFSRTQQLTRASRWSANLTLQRSRTKRDPGADDDWSTTTTASLYYNNSHFLNVSRLRFESELRAVSNSVRPLVADTDAPGEQLEDVFWRNRLDYTIGRMELSFRVNFADQDGNLNTLVFFLVRRNLGPYLFQ